MDGKNPWHCWISNEKGKTIHSLFKKLKVDRELFTELNKIVSDYKPSTKSGIFSYYNPRVSN
jgi:hypothetical protein